MRHKKLVREKGIPKALQTKIISTISLFKNTAVEFVFVNDEK